MRIFDIPDPILSGNEPKSSFNFRKKTESGNKRSILEKFQILIFRPDLTKLRNLDPDPTVFSEPYLDPSLFQKPDPQPWFLGH